MLEHWRTPVLWALVGLLTLIAVRGWINALASIAWPPPGGDFELYRGAAARWLAGGLYYEPYQLAGTYDGRSVLPMPVLYPPTTIPLFAAFTILPVILWWAIPGAVIAAVLVQLRPKPAALAAILAIAALPQTVVTVVWTGNPTLWLIAAGCLAVSGRTWAAPLILLKPTLSPFALVGIRSRSWWIGLATLGIVSLGFASLWSDYVRATLNAQGWGLLYSSGHWPAMMVPLVAWAGRSMRRSSS